MRGSNLRRSVLLGGVSFAIFGSVQPYRLVRVTGPSMEPIYLDGEFVVARTDVGQIHAGDVVVIDTDSGPIIKRVAWAPGDAFMEAKLPLAGWTPVRMPKEGHPDPNFQFRAAKVPEGFLFVLGDNKPNSIDSRSFGFVAVSKVRAKLVSSRPGPPLILSWLPQVRPVA